MLVVKSLEGPNRCLPYYFNMRVGQFVTQIAAPAMGCAVHENGDVYDRFVLKGAHVFTKANKDKYLAEVVEDCATLFYSICLGRIDPVLVGNGSRMPPTQYQLTLRPDVKEEQDCGATDSKKRKGDGCGASDNKKGKI
jgi:hypothetical protein